MSADLVIPRNNETEFVEIAAKLGIKKFYFLYDFDEYNEGKIQKKFDTLNHHNINIEIGFIVNQKNLSKAFKASRLLAVKSSDHDRFFIESKKIKVIYGFGEVSKKDSMHQKSSGLNHIICELAMKNNITVGFSYSSLFNKNLAVSSLLIGRIIQNISLCQKYKVKTIIGSFSEKPFDLRASHDIMSLFAMIGMHQKEVNNSLTNT